jgi:hypothetical protein
VLVTAVVPVQVAHVGALAVGVQRVVDVLEQRAAALVRDVPLLQYDFYNIILSRKLIHNLQPFLQFVTILKVPRL